MNVSCPSCQTKYSVDDSRVPPSGVTIKCPKCSHTFVAKRDDAAVALPGQARSSNPVALPGKQASAVPLPGKKPAPRKDSVSDDLLDALDLGLDDSSDNLPAPKDLPGLPSKGLPPKEKSKTISESGVLDFIDSTKDKARAKEPAAPIQHELKVRRRNGRVEGPYGVGRILAMLRNGEYKGNEDISEDGVSWRAMTSHPELNQAINQASAASDPMAFGDRDLGGGDMDLGMEADAPPQHHAPPPRPAHADPNLNADLDLDDSAMDDPHDGHGGGHGGHGAAPAEEELPSAPRERGRRGEDELEVGDIPELPPIWQTYRKPILIFMGAIVLILIGVFTQLFTPYGAFGIKGLVAAITKEAPPPVPVKPPPPCGRSPIRKRSRA
jgi:predicted Zn finger-like uncharacterized protein